MNEINTSQLVEFQDGEVTTTSLQVAEQFEKNHRDVLRAIDALVGGLRNIALTPNIDNWFKESTYIHEQNHREFRMYDITKNGFVLLAGGFTDKKFMEFKVKYIEQFDAMEKYIREQEQNQFFMPETPDQQTKRITAEAYKMQCENGRMKELRLAMKQAGELERKDLAEILLEKEVETFVGQPIKRAVAIELEK